MRFNKQQPASDLCLIHCASQIGDQPFGNGNDCLGMVSHLQRDNAEVFCGRISRYIREITIERNQNRV
jgi:hypothetical protein